MPKSFKIPDRSDFPLNFKFGSACSALQIEGELNRKGAGLSNWEHFLRKKPVLQDLKMGNGFYEKFQEDLKIAKTLGLKEFRLSISWSRLQLNGRGDLNHEGLDFYLNLLKSCQDLGLEPWVTLYHWDHPQALEEEGGWTNRDMVEAFSDFAEICMQLFSAYVSKWFIFNEPAVVAGAGHFLGVHAPGRKGMRNFLPCIHHILLAQGRAFRRMKSIDSKAEIGTALSMMPVHVPSLKGSNLKANARVDALMNRLFLEPALGLDYPYEALPWLKKIKKYMEPNDKFEIQVDFDFIGVQTYTRLMVEHKWYIPFIKAQLKTAESRGKLYNAMGWEIYPRAVYEVLVRLKSYKNLPPLYISETGIPLKDELQLGRVEDPKRVKYIKETLFFAKKAMHQGVDLKGIFFWSLTDNVEWIHGNKPRFGLVHVNYRTNERTLKASAHWLKSWLGSKKSEFKQPATAVLGTRE